jgi:alkylhydroperoxidase family enzyme
MKRSLIIAAIVLFTSTSVVFADDEPNSTPKPIPAFRPEMKAALEALKQRQPRLPLRSGDQTGGVNNGRMRAHYLPENWGGGGARGIGGGNRTARSGNAGSRPGQDPNALLDYAFTTSCFWVVSRGNNCHYCLGHQELKLRGAGLSDDDIAALDCDWSGFEPRMQAALGYTRKLTIEPQLVGADDIANLKKVFSDPEIIELTFDVARFNATNRWTDGMGLPQDQRFSGDEPSKLDTPTSEQFQHRVSLVAPTTRAPRPPAATLQEAQAAIAGLRDREPRVAIPSEADARTALGDALGDRAPLLWERAMSSVGDSGKAQVNTLNIILTDDHLTPRLKQELAFIAAMNNRAWYAAAHAAHRLKTLGASPEDLTSLLGENEQSMGGAAAAYQLAAKSTANPHLITDADLAKVREHFSDAETAEIMQVICMANLFDRFTEALGLPLEDGIADGIKVSQR